MDPRVLLFIILFFIVLTIILTLSLQSWVKKDDLRQAGLNKDYNPLNPCEKDCKDDKKDSDDCKTCKANMNMYSDYFFSIGHDDGNPFGIYACNITDDKLVCDGIDEDRKEALTNKYRVQNDGTGDYMLSNLDTGKWCRIDPKQDNKVICDIDTMEETIKNKDHNSRFGAYFKGEWLPGEDTGTMCFDSGTPQCDKSLKLGPSLTEFAFPPKWIYDKIEGTTRADKQKAARAAKEANSDNNVVGADVHIYNYNLKTITENDVSLYCDRNDNGDIHCNNPTTTGAMSFVYYDADDA